MGKPARCFTCGKPYGAIELDFDKITATDVNWRNNKEIKEKLNALYDKHNFLLCCKIHFNQVIDTNKLLSRKTHLK